MITLQCYNRREGPLPKLTFKLKGLQTYFQKLTAGLRPQRQGTCWQAKQTVLYLLCRMPTAMLTAHSDNVSEAIFSTPVSYLFYQFMELGSACW